MNNTSNIKHDTSAQLMLSIVVPVYNAEEYLEECLLSLYKQDIPLESFEVIAVDNGSRDSSAAIIDRLQIEYPNLRKVTLEINQFPSGARNAGMDVAQGKYLMFVDSDDYLHPNVLRSLTAFIEKDNLDFVHFNVDCLSGGQITHYSTSPTTPIMTGVELYHHDIRLREVSWSKIYRRSFIEQHHLRCARGLLTEDNEFAYRLFSLATHVRHVEISPYICGENQSSATSRKKCLINIESDLAGVNALYDDIHGQNKVITDPTMIQEIKQLIRYDIVGVFQIYHLLDKSDQKIAKRKMQKYITWRMLPYVSKKKFILLHLGIIR